MRRYASSIVLGIVAGVGSWFFGLPLIPSIVVGLVIAGVGIVLRAVAVSTESREWPPPPPEPSDGTRHEVPELSWALRAPGGVVDDRIVERIRQDGLRILRRKHLDIDEPADRGRIERLVGAQTYTVLSSRATKLTLASLLSVLESLERLERTDSASRGSQPL